MPKRRIAALVGVLFLALSGCAGERGAGVGERPSRLEKEGYSTAPPRIPMRDGVKLESMLFLPAAAGPFPVLLARSPHDYSDWIDRCAMYSREGYAVVLQNVRGRFESEGRWQPLVNEASDGYDAIQWIAGQPWCSGRVGMFGDSYLATAQVLAASQYPSALSAMVPRFPGAGYWSTHGPGGAEMLAFPILWNMHCRDEAVTDLNEQTRNKLFMTLPVSEVLGIEGRRGAAGSAPEEAVPEGPLPPPGPGTTAGELPATMIITGWWEQHSTQALRYHEALVARAKDQPASGRHALIVGPWGAHPSSVERGPVDYGADASYDWQAEEKRWLDRWVKGTENGIDREPPVKLFVMGLNIWRNELHWPPRRVMEVNYYLHSKGKANSRNGDGALDVLAPGPEPPDRFRYDPQDPVWTLGGKDSELGPLLGFPQGPRDQRDIEGRQDVLVYSSQPLMKDVEVTGYIRVVLYAASSAPDTDFTAKLVDVHPSGEALNVADGIVRASYREGPENRQLIDPGKVYRYEIDLGATSQVFLEGHRLRLQISSSNFPMYTRNLNTEEDPLTGTRFQIATQTVLHDADHPSHIVLPVCPPR